MIFKYFVIVCSSVAMVVSVMPSFSEWKVFYRLFGAVKSICHCKK